MEIHKSSSSEDSSISDPDRELLAAFAGGDRSALEKFIRTHEQRLAQIAYRILGCQSAAEDAIHTVFVRLISEFEDITRLANPAAWLTRCVVNDALTRVRQNAREKRLLSSFPARRVCDSEASALESLVNAEARSELQLTLQSLSPMQRTLVSLRFDEGMTFQKIAELLGKPPSTIKSQLAKTIALLRNLLSSVRKQQSNSITQG